MSGYEATLQLAEKQPHYDISPPHGNGQGDWLEVVRACLETYDGLDEGGEFAGSWVNRNVDGWFPGLSTLAKHGILEKGGSARGRNRRYYTITDPEGVIAALTELGYWWGKRNVSRYRIH